VSDQPTGTIFDSPWFTFERPAFRKIAAESDEVLTCIMIALALGIIVIALTSRNPLLKAVIIAYCILP
jgi:hypothetical protein